MATRKFLYVGADGQYVESVGSYETGDYISTSAGAADAGKPVVLDVAGQIDASMINSADVNHSLLTGLANDDHTQYILADGTRAFSGSQSMGGNSITSLGNPTLGTDAVNLQTMQSYLNGLKPKEAVRIATTVAGTLATSFANGSTIDGVAITTGDRILIKDQASALENGIYTVNASGAPTRATDFDSLSPIDEINGSYVAVQEGTANTGKSFVQQGTVATLGTDAINFVFFNAADTITASTGLVKVIDDIRLDVSSAGDGLGFTTGVLNVNVDNVTVETNADTLRVKAAGINDTHIDFGTGVNQVSASDLPILDANSYFTATNQEGVNDELFSLIGQQGVTYTVGTGGINKGDVAYISANDTVLPYSTLTNSHRGIGLALSTATAASTVKVLANDTILTGVLTAATSGTPYYWNGTSLVTSIPNGSGAYVWQAGVAKNATDLHVEVRLVKRNA